MVDTIDFVIRHGKEGDLPALEWEGEYARYRSVYRAAWDDVRRGERAILVAQVEGLIVGQIFERIFIVGPLMDGDRCAGAVGFSVREDKFYVFKAKATLVAMGGAVHVFKPRSSGEGMGRAWYPPWNSGSSAYFTLKAGASQTVALTGIAQPAGVYEGTSVFSGTGVGSSPI